jgi:hypothetical protein
VNRVTNLQQLARAERAESARVLVRRIFQLDRTDLPRPGERWRLPTGPIIELVALVEDDSEVRCRYLIDGLPGDLPEHVVGFTLVWLRKHAAPLGLSQSENAA